ncbi:MAG: RidA family protein [Anaerolineales bacterium]|nr:RidA family protein [Anaerolineales bacterium]
MSKQIITPPLLPEPRGFNHGVLTAGGRILWLAGQDAGGPGGEIVAPGDLTAQFEQVLRNLKAVVEEAGGSMLDIVKLNIYTTDRDLYKGHLPELGRLMKAYFGNYYPAMAWFEVSSLYQDEALVEMEGYAVL